MPVEPVALRHVEAGEGAALLFLHGFPFDASLWQPQLDALPLDWRGIAPDLRGFGRSPQGADGSAEMRLMAVDVLALLGRLDVAEAVVCGLSMGGYVAFEVWRRAPERVRAPVLADTRPGQDGAEGRANRARVAERARTDGTTGIIDEMLPKLLSAETRRERPHVAQTLRRIMAAQTAEAVARASLGMADRMDSTALLPDIDVPVLCIAGAEDTLTPPDVAQQMAAAAPDGRAAILPGAGHVSNLEAPEAFDEALFGFIAELR